MLSERQIQLLNAIINEYVNSSEPVGSVEVVKKYNLKCSAATVRNEMAKLIDLGFLDMLHTSSGRIPTRMAYRYYLDELMEEEDMPVLQEVAIKQRVWPIRFHFEKMLREAMLSLADVTNYLAVGTSEDGFVTHAGAVNVLDNKEFWEIDTARAALTLLDSAELLEKIFENAPMGGGQIKVAIENEIGIDNLDKCALVFTPYSVGKRSGYLAVLGPSRMDYPKVIPAVKYTKGLIEELGESW
jgi:transcriptional regulator of heat shock response